LVRGLDADLRLEQAGAAARGTLARLRQPLFVKGEAANPASGRHDRHGTTRRPHRSNYMVKIFFDISTASAELTRE